MSVLRGCYCTRAFSSRTSRREAAKHETSFSLSVDGVDVARRKVVTGLMQFLSKRDSCFMPQLDSLCVVNDGRLNVGTEQFIKLFIKHVLEQVIQFFITYSIKRTKQQLIQQ